MDPNKLTVDQLKTELKEHNVSFTISPRMRKSDYVQLYKEQVLSNDAPDNRVDKHGFSSDEDESFMGRKVYKTTTTTTTVTLNEDDVYELSDDDLMHYLKLYNIKAGPIVDSTRGVYQRKLIKQLKGGSPKKSPKKSTQTVVEHKDIYSDSDEEESYAAETQDKVMTTANSYDRFSHLTNRSPYARQSFGSGLTDNKTTSTTSSYQSTEYKTSSLYGGRRIGDVPLTYTGERSIAAEVSKPVSSSSSKPAKKRLALWVQVVILIVAIVLIFLVVQNMDPSYKNPVKELHNKP